MRRAPDWSRHLVSRCLPRLLAAQRGRNRRRNAPTAWRTDDRPRPIVEALEDEHDDESDAGSDDSGGDNSDDPAPSEIADGIQIATPARRDEILEAIETTDGDAISLGDDPIEATLDRLHRKGFYVEPTSAVAPAALEAYRADGVIDETDDVVVPLTGSGLKTL